MMDNMGGGEMMKGKACNCPHHKMTPLLVVLFALDFLGGNLGWWGQGFVNTSWPVLVGLAGIMKMMEGKCKCC